jgi:hypothetical protein
MPNQVFEKSEREGRVPEKELALSLSISYLFHLAQIRTFVR